jgi:hypothetical protein
LESHFLFGHHFCRVGRGNEKGHVENHVGKGAKAEPVLSPGGSPRRASRCCCTWPRAPRSPPTPGLVPRRHESARPAPAAARRFRRGAGDHLRLRAGARPEPAPEMCDPSLQEHPRQGAQARPVEVRPTTGGSSTTSTPRRTRPPSPRPARGPSASSRSGGRSTPRRSSASRTTSSISSPICTFPRSTRSASGTSTSSSAPSGRPAGARR